MSISKFAKAIEKKGYSTTFSKIDNWSSFGSCALNYIITGSLVRGVPNRRTGAIAGPSGSGKSFIFGKLISNIQNDGYTVVYIDTENAIDEEFLVKLGVDVSDEVFIPLRLSTIEELTETMSTLFKEFGADEKVAVFVDSMSNLETEKDAESFDKGELANSFGLLPKKIKQLVKSVNAKIGDRDMYFIYNLHTYMNQDTMNGEGKFMISGGSAQMFIPSWSIMLDKLRLKEGAEQVGIRMKAHSKKTRYFKTGTAVEIHIPWATGMDPLYGVPEILERHGVVSKAGAWYSYADRETGEVKKFQRKTFAEHADYLIDIFEKEFVDVEEAADEDPTDE